MLIKRGAYPMILWQLSWYFDTLRINLDREFCRIQYHHQECQCLLSFRWRNCVGRAWHFRSQYDLGFDSFSSFYILSITSHQEIQQCFLWENYLLKREEKVKIKFVLYNILFFWLVGTKKIIYGTTFNWSSSAIRIHRVSLRNPRKAWQKISLPL